MQQRTKESTRHVDVLLRALDILDCFMEESSLSMRQIIKKTGLVRSRAMRLVGTLELRGYINENQETKRYTLGFRSAMLGKAFQRNNKIENFVRPVLRYLVDKTHESATFYIVDGLERVALFREEGTNAIRFSIEEGQSEPIHAGAASKVLLGFGPPELFDSIAAKRKLPRITSETITSPQLLKKELKDIRKRGYATSKGENIPDSYSVAAPVFSYENELIGSIGVAGPASRVTDGIIKERIKLVVEASRILSERLGYLAKKDERMTREAK